MDIFIKTTMFIVVLYICLFITIFSYVFILALYTELILPIIKLIKRI